MCVCVLSILNISGVDCFYFHKKYVFGVGGPRGVIVKAMDCGIVVSEFVIQSRYYHIYPTPPLGQDMTQGQFFKWSLTGLNSAISF